MGERGVRVIKENIKGPMDKAKSGVVLRVVGRDGWDRGVGMGKMETTVLEQQ